ncbi:MAG: amidohydrolase family protein [Acidobacteria bacterium]|nr:amidohydrolase family protein [Acidobacteriota bacterium]
MKRTAIFSLLLITVAATVWGQKPDVATKLGYPQLIIYNAKIVTMDDASFRSSPGTIVQAMAIRDKKILATGTHGEIRSLAGSQTRQVDLKGRTVLPSFIMTHEHPTDWAFQEPEALKHVLPEDNDFLIVRWLKPAPPQEQFAAFEPTFKEAVASAKPGQWILLSFHWGPEYEYATEMQNLFPKFITKARLDQLAPNHPVKVKNGFITSVINSKALEELRKVHPSLQVMEGPRTPDEIKSYEETGFGFSRPVEPDVIFRGKTALLADVLKAEMEIWASYGITTYGSSPYAFSNFQALSYLDRRGDMPARFAWGYTGPDFDVDTLRYVAGLLGHGTDHLWNIGAWATPGGTCTTLDASSKVKQSERCAFAPGSLGRETLERIIRAGGRIATLHSGGDKDIDYFLDAIEKASQDAGLTLEEVRSKRHAFDHGEGAPRPDQIPRIKNLGMILSEINTNLWETHRGASRHARNYGIEYASWVVPRKSVTAAGIMNSFEIDRPLPHKVFPFIHKGITRYNDRDQKVYGAREATDRIIQLKALTTWGSYYVLREKTLGTLEPGKFADFIVLDRDYLTIPEGDIPNIRVLMTAVDGRPVHLVPSLAREIGMQAVGPVTWRGQSLPYLVDAAKDLKDSNVGN